MKELCSAIMQHTLQDLLGFIDWWASCVSTGYPRSKFAIIYRVWHQSTVPKRLSFCPLCPGYLVFVAYYAGPLTKIYPDKLRLATIQCFFSCIQSAIWAMAVERNISAWKLGWDLNLLVVAYCAIIFPKRGSIFSAAFNPLAFIVTAIFSAFLWKETPQWGSVLALYY
ncbi:unnamed protein product [Camellia sinensis]